MTNVKHLSNAIQKIVGWCLTFLLFVSTGCQPICVKMNPPMSCPVSVETITSLPSPFPPFSSEESDSPWGREMKIADFFARDWDLYRAISCYKRALVLLPKEGYQARKEQIEYDIILSYYLGNKTCELLKFFELSSISQASPTFPAFNQLLLMIYDSYLQEKAFEKAACVLQAIEKYSPDTKEDLLLYQAFKEGNEEEVSCLIAEHRDNEELKKKFFCYEKEKKSPKKAQLLNALLPGAGYYYVGEKKSALTSFMINALFTLASYQFFAKGYPAAGAITASMEMGWYMGGINGAGIEAQAYNTGLFDGLGRKILCEEAAFPILMFETSF